MKFFKALGKGVLYFFTPFIWIIAISIGSILGIVLFVGYSLFMIFLFFTGRNFFKELPEDKEVKRLKELETVVAEEPKVEETPINPSSPTMVQEEPMMPVDEPIVTDSKTEEINNVWENPTPNDSYQDEHLEESNDSFEEEDNNDPII